MIRQVQKEILQKNSSVTLLSHIGEKEKYLLRVKR